MKFGIEKTKVRFGLNFTGTLINMMTNIQENLVGEEIIKEFPKKKQEMDFLKF